MADRNSWGTPVELYYPIKKVFPFVLDLAADEHNRLCSEYYSFEDSAFDVQDWSCVGGAVWCNPPYGKQNGGILSWVNLCYKISDESGQKVVILLPGDHGTAWYSEALDLCDTEIRLTPRVQFVPPLGVKSSSNPKPSTLFVFGGYEQKHVFWHWKQEELSDVY